MRKLLIFSVLFFLLLFTNSFSQLSDYKYEYPIVIKNLSTATLTNYPVTIIFNTEIPIGQGWIQPDGRDIRFVSDCGGSTIYTHWLSGYLNTDTTKFFVKIPSIPPNDSVLIYMFCGNDSALQTSTINALDGPHSSTDSVIVTSTNTVSNCQRGFRFTPQYKLYVSHFGKRIPNATQRYVTLFDFTTQAILAQIRVDAGTIGIYNYNELSQPLILDSGRTCILALFNDVGDMYYYGTSSQIGQHLTYHDMRFCGSCTQNTFPTSVLSNYHYGTPDFLYYIKPTINPEPTFSIKPPADTVTPSAPTGLTLTAGDVSANAVWNSNQEFDMYYYLIYRNTELNTGTAALVDSVFHPDTTFTNTGLTNGVKYYFWIKAVDRFCINRISDFSLPDSVIPTSVGISNPTTEIPNKYALHQNYPNPFNPVTNIQFDLPEASFVTIVIYDMLGREVERLIDEKKSAGRYVISWNAGNLSSGVYIYKMTTNKFTDTRKLTLIK